MRDAMSEPDRYRAQAAGELRALKKAIDELPVSEIDRLVEMARVISAAIEGGKAVFTCGNGGSAADAQHIAGELVGRFRRKKTSGYRAFALTVNSSVVTSIANDYSYDEIFSRQLESRRRAGRRPSRPLDEREFSERPEGRGDGRLARHDIARLYGRGRRGPLPRRRHILQGARRRFREDPGDTHGGGPHPLRPRRGNGLGRRARNFPVTAARARSGIV